MGNSHYETWRKAAREALASKKPVPADLVNPDRTKYTFQLFVGANNETGFVEEVKLRAILLALYEGFTMQEAVGAWRGKIEDTVIVTLHTDSVSLATTIRRIKNELGQEAVGVLKFQAMAFL